MSCMTPVVNVVIVVPAIAAKEIPA
jgi:hypothetical protein